MKKYLLGILFIVGLSACSNQDKPALSQPSTPSSPTSEQTQSEDMPFEQCIQVQKAIQNSLAGTQYKVITIVDTPEVSLKKFCTNDGAVLHTCSALDKKAVTVKTDNKQGCE